MSSRTASNSTTASDTALDSASPSTAPSGAASSGAAPRVRRRERKRHTRRFPRLAEAMHSGWLSDQHGAWGMAFFPLGAGLILAPNLPGANWRLLALSLTWVVGFLFFDVAGRWISFRFRRLYLPAVICYGVFTAIFGALTIVLSPSTLSWAPVYAPLLALSAWWTQKRAHRNLLPRLVTVATAMLIIPVAATVAANEPWWTTSAFDSQLWAVFGLLGAYFVGSIPYVKTLIRKRRSTAWLAGSIAYHVIALLGILIAEAITPQIIGWPSVLAWIVVASRAIIMPLWARRRGTPWHPKYIGALEGVISLLVFAALPWAGG